MFSTYKQAVLRDYLFQKDNGVLALRLQTPTPAGVKDHLIQYLGKHYNARKDEQILEMFFDHQDNVAAYARAIDRIDIGKFKPVIKFLKGDTPNPEDKQVHLAALLINFERPYEFGRDYSTEEEEASEIEKQEDEETDSTDNTGDQIEVGDAIDGDIPRNVGDEETDDVEVQDGEAEEISGQAKSAEKQETNVPDVMPVFESGNEKKNKWRQWLNSNGGRRTVIPLSVLVAISLGFVLKGTIDDPKGKQCMYWKDDRYVAIACDAKLPEETEKIALDTFVLDHFRMITEPDTISERSIGKVWYLKHQKKFDYFTIRGVHPIHGRRLSRLSDLIYKNEIDAKRKEKASSL